MSSNSEQSKDYTFVNNSLEEACLNWVKMLAGLSSLTETEINFLTEFVIRDYKYRETAPHIVRGDKDFEYKLSIYLVSHRVKEEICTELDITSAYFALLLNRCRNKKVILAGEGNSICVNPIYCFPKDGKANIVFTLSE
ncbi:MAG: hypothetical protein EBU90_01520 [Proteobacteria bacterium]|nr:hypothetical protein [Pseudomonadota bacterium]